MRCRCPLRRSPSPRTPWRPSTGPHLVRPAALLHAAPTRVGARGAGDDHLVLGIVAPSAGLVTTIDGPTVSTVHERSPGSGPPGRSRPPVRRSCALRPPDRSTRPPRAGRRSAPSSEHSNVASPLPRRRHPERRGRGRHRVALLQALLQRGVRRFDHLVADPDPRPVPPRPSPPPRTTTDHAARVDGRRSRTGPTPLPPGSAHENADATALPTGTPLRRPAPPRRSPDQPGRRSTCAWPGSGRSRPAR